MCFLVPVLVLVLGSSKKAEYKHEDDDEDEPIRLILSGILLHCQFSSRVYYSPTATSGVLPNNPPRRRARLARTSSIRLNSAGTKNKVKIVDTISPPKTTAPKPR